MVKRGENILEELIHYVTIHNDRDRQATSYCYVQKIPSKISPFLSL